MLDLKNFEVLLWDLDGTLTDPKEGITNSICYALQKFGIPAPDKNTLLPFIGPPLIDSFQKYYGFSEEQAKLAVTYYREYFPEKGIFENELYPGIPEVLEGSKKRGVRHIMATSKPEVYARRIADHFGLTPYFTRICGANLDGSRTKKDEVIAYALQTIPDIPKERVLMVGDRLHDVEGAKKNGLCVLGVCYGYGGAEELIRAGADDLVQTVEELKQRLG